MHYFSPSTGLNVAAVPQQLPADAIVIDEATHSALVAAQEAGATIAVGPDGQPQAFGPVPDLRWYAPSTGGFYDPSIHDVIPADAVQISAATHVALLEAQAAGAVIQPGPDGQPEAVTPAAPDPAEVLAAWRARASLTRLQFALVCTGANLMTAAEAEDLVARGEIPAIGLAALDLITDPAQQALARVRFAGFQRLDRLDPAVALLASAAAMLDEDVDALFEAGALL